MLFGSCAVSVAGLGPWLRIGSVWLVFSRGQLICVWTGRTLHDEPQALVGAVYESRKEAEVSGNTTPVPLSLSAL